MSSFWLTNQAYLDHVEARSRGDHATAARILETALAESDLSDHPYWLVAKAGLCHALTSLPDRTERAWDCLYQALRMAPSDYELKRGLFGMAVALAIGDRSERLPELVRQLHPEIRRLIREPQIAYNIGAMRYYRGDLRQSLLWVNRAIRLGYGATNPHKRSLGLVQRATLCALLGRLSEAQASLDAAHGDMWKTTEVFFEMAKAEIALARGQVASARSYLQEAASKSLFPKHPSQMAVFDMLAARIARAEGNLEAYHQYSARALERCKSEDGNMVLDLVHTLMVLRPMCPDRPNEGEEHVLVLEDQPGLQRTCRGAGPR